MTTLSIGALNNRFIGDSSDVKPTTGENGSIFFDTDTGKTYVWDGSAWSNSGMYPNIDASTHARVGINHSHHECHDGDYYRSGMNFTLANGNVSTFGIVTHATKEMHVTWDLTATANGVFAVLEDVTSFSGGASVTPLNHNRNSLNVSAAICTRGMTGSNLITPTGGTTILNATLGTGKGSSVSRSSGQEFILKHGSKYLFRYTNGTSSNVIQLAMEWYEHTPKE